MKSASSKLTDEEIINIYDEEYIGQHIGGSSLMKKYSLNFYPDFNRLGLKMRNNKEKNKLYACDINYFKDIDTEEKAYWLGFCYADGFISRNNGNIRFGISIMNDDIEHLKKFNKAINSTYPINTYSVTKGYKVGTLYSRIIITDDTFAQNLINHGCVEHKSNIMEPPIGLPENLEKHFIRGFMDANGSISICKTKYGPGYEIKFASTDNVLKWIMQHLIKNNIISREYPIYKRKKEHIVSAISFGGNNLVKKYLDYIYDGASVWLDRKHERYIRLCEWIQYKKKVRPTTCCVCGRDVEDKGILWVHEGEYYNQILCKKHYFQMRKYNKIIPDKKDRCDLCGDNTGKLTHVGNKYPDYHGMTMCKRHYTQLVTGVPLDHIKGKHK